MIIDIPFDTSISKASLEALIRSMEAEYCQVAIAVKMTEFNYAALEAETELSDEDKATLESLDKKVQSWFDAMKFHLSNIDYFKTILANYDK